jgi:hypothetical protein
MNNYRQLATGAYLVAFLLFVIPFFDAIMSVIPAHFDNTQWRFAVLGLLSNALMLPASGALIAVATAAMLGHVRLQRVLGILLWLLVVVVMVSAVTFSLDAIQSRPAIKPDMLLSYQVASTTALAKLVLGAVTFAFLAAGCRGASAEVIAAAPRVLKRDIAK